MRVHSPRRVSQSPLAVAAGVSIGLHLLLLAAVLLVRAPTNSPLVKRGEPLFVELPEVDQSAQRGAPAAPASPPPARPSPPVPPAAKAPPQPQSEPRPPQPRTPQPPRVANAPVANAPKVPAAPPSEPAAPAGEAPRVATAPSRPPEPSESEPTRTPEIPPQEPAAPSPPKVAVAPEPRPEMPDIRSALRRGGPGGGAGGLGEGRGGITGSPIQLDTKDPRYSDYFQRIQRMIQAKMIYPCVKNPQTFECEYRSAQLLVEFGILKDGQLQFVEVVSGADRVIFDDYSVNAIKLAAPFPPVPPSLMATLKPGTTGVPVAARFVYILESSFRGLVR
jgi:outer membrane biosynthesis protein TonB